MYNVIFSFGETINLGKCVVSAKDDTTVSLFYNSTESLYKTFTSYYITPGEKVYTNIDGRKILLSPISSVTSTILTLSSNPGEIVYNEVLRKGFFTPYVVREQNIYSYPIKNYLGASLIKKGGSYYTYPEASPFNSAATATSTNSIISLFFQKGQDVDEVRINVSYDNEEKVIQDINIAFRQEKDISFGNIKNVANSNIIGINSVISSSIKDFY